ncbi:MAG: HAD-IIB family hydrolase [Clostridia bacterium]|nr:HAD-IIB family hydrolase [Clostridia bacterium]
MNIKLVASDLDGTIIDRNNFIANENFKAIDKLNSKNIDFVVCTGKSYSVSKSICNDFKAKYGIFGNGAQIIDLQTGEELNRKILKPKQISYCIKLAKRNNLHIHFYTEDAIVTENLKYMDLRNYILKDINKTELKFFIVPDIEKYIAENNPDIFSFVISSVDSLEGLEKEINKHLTVSTSLISKKGIYKDNIINKEYEYLNIAPNNINKNQALSFLSNYLQIPQADMLAIGDNVNDLEMVKHSGIGIAVGDAYTELKNVAQYVTQKNVTDGAFAEAINKFIK